MNQRVKGQRRFDGRPIPSAIIRILSMVICAEQTIGMIFREDERNFVKVDATTLCAAVCVSI